MKKVLLLTLISLSNAFAGYGIVTTLEAPILNGISLDSKVIMTARKGQKIYIHDKYFINGPLEVVYRADDKQKSDELSRLEGENGYERFYETVDKNGNTAYISRYFVKLITNDTREFTQHITPFEPDPNDYRPEEPLPKNYPLTSPIRNRARLTFLMGPDIKSNYNYNSILEEEDFSNRYGFELSYGSKANWDSQDRFYFGGLLQGWTSQAKFRLFDERTTTENKAQLAVGPYISYDPWRSRFVNFTIQASLLVSYTRFAIQQRDLDGFDEERIFSSLSVSPKASSFFQFQTDDQDLDIVAGIDLQFYMPHNLRSSKQPETNFWNDYQSAQDTVYVPLTAHWSFFLGIQSRY
jgi:hypothetical protein